MAVVDLNFKSQLRNLLLSDNRTVITILQMIEVRQLIQSDLEFAKSLTDAENGEIRLKTGIGYMK